ncbi:hypothetical protein [Microbacterium indicum]|uniref:hypothetical protein n=1 Tax=Microbacterium indicum TaxID=358100 RepID=UPI000412AB07|nr:hypothetical protein [Microbacterium indicum]
METITQREMRNNSGDVLRRAAAGERFRVGDAVIGPAGAGGVDGLIAGGGARGPVGTRDAVLGIPAAESPMSSAEIVADARGEW